MSRQRMEWNIWIVDNRYWIFREAETGAYEISNTQYLFFTLPGLRSRAVARSGRRAGRAARSGRVSGCVRRPAVDELAACTVHHRDESGDGVFQGLFVIIYSFKGKT